MIPQSETIRDDWRETALRALVEALARAAARADHATAEFTAKEAP